MQTDAEVAAIAAGLTKAQRRIVCEMPEDRHFVDAYIYCRQRRTRMALNNGGITEPQRNGAVTTWWMIRLSDLGLRVAQHLKQENSHG